MYFAYVFFFKQKTAYEMRISDWSSDVCSSDLQAAQLLDSRTTRRSPDMAAQTGMVRGGLAPWQIKQLRTHITENLASPIALEELAAICRLSVSHFSRAFKTSFGEPPHSYIMRQSIEEAKRSEEHTSELQSLMRISYAVFCLK